MPLNRYKVNEICFCCVENVIHFQKCITFEWKYESYNLIHLEMFLENMAKFSLIDVISCTLGIIC